MSVVGLLLHNSKMSIAMTSKFFVVTTVKSKNNQIYFNIDFSGISFSVFINAHYTTTHHYFLIFRKFFFYKSAMITAIIELLYVQFK